MKISQKAISSFNTGKDPSFNENWNKAHGIHSVAEHALFSTVQWHDSGIRKLPISLKKVREWVELNPTAFNKISNNNKVKQ